ncbi:MAG: hypothetical protein VYB61_06195 [Verrucomicrobiota bacterium]|nr:hypothetical protein [Verrucomicrobiota bacterium]
MTHPNPFQDSIFDGDLRIAPSSSAVLYPDAEQSLNALISSLTAKESPDHGYIRLIHCPRAGFGKSHLLAKILSDARQACILPISFNHENPANWQEVFTQTMHCLSRCRKKNVPDVLSETSRLLFAELVGELVQQGIVPSSNPETARHGLQDNYQNMFDLKGAGSPIATWFKANFKALAVPLAGELHNRTGLDVASCRLWINLLYRYESGDLESISRATANLNSSQARQKLHEVSRLVSRYRPIIMVFDNLDSFRDNQDEAYNAAYIFSEIARTGIAALTFISINDDIWESGFAEKIPDAVADRITDGRIKLAGISIDCARALLTERMQANPGNQHWQEQLFAAVNLEAVYGARQKADLSPRELIRLAHTAWAENPSGKAAPHEAPADEPQEENNESIIREPLQQSAHETLGRIRKMLRGVNQRNPEKEPYSHHSPAPKQRIAPWKQISHDASPALREFARKRDEIFQNENLLLDTTAIRHALELAGRRSPLLDYREFDVVEGSSASCWRSPDHEILFGFEPAERIPYWRALIEQAGESPLTLSKVVAFTPEGTPPIIREGLNGEARERLDILELDRGALASIAATRKILLHADSQEDTFAQIAPELDFLWRRITRPMPTSS